jgi:hypothetical protein
MEAIFIVISLAAVIFLLPAFFTVVNALAPAAVQQASDAFDRGGAFWRGLSGIIPFGLLILLSMLIGESPLLIALSWVVSFLLVIACLLGLAGMSRSLGHRLTGKHDRVSNTFLGMILIIACWMVPFVGWFVALPYTLFSALGTTFSGFLLFRTKRVKPSTERFLRRIKSWFGPALVLFFLSPMIGELLSGSAPPAEFFNPFSLFLLTALYGSGAVIIRELSFRWRKGWPTIITLGLAYGILEEALMVKSFFDPNWMDLGLLGSYGRWLGVNWIWSIELTIYHALFSIAIPIFLVQMMFPKRVEEPWVSRRTFWALVILLAVDVLIGFLLLTAYFPPLPLYLMAGLTVIILVMLARRLPKRFFPHREADDPGSPIWYLILGFSSTLTLFFMNWLLPDSRLPAIITAGLNLVLPVLVLLLVRLLSKAGSAWGWSHQFALVAGGLGFFILLGPIQELDPSRMDNTSGMTLVAIGFSLGLIVLNVIRRRSKWQSGLGRDGPEQAI